MSKRSLDTDAIHAGALDPRPAGAVITPVFQSANYEQGDVATYADVTYLRLNNTPNHRVLAARLAALEGAEAALVSASGMAAISGALLTLLSAGDHLLLQRTVYGGTRTFVEQEAARFGIGHTDVDPTAPETWEAALTPRTRVFYVESLSNPLLEVTELEAVVAFARAHGLIAVIDNTFLSPVGFRPVEHGFDLVLHSATKLLNGHSDLVAGVVAGRAALVERILHTQTHLGGSLDAHACFLLERGLKTLGVRVRRQVATARRLAEALAAHPAVESVRYPGLPGHPGHALAARLFDGFGSMIAFTPRDQGTTDRFLAGLGLPLHAASLGGVETLVVQPARSSHLGVDRAVREAQGITDRLIRVSVGLEDPDELVADVLRALG